MWSVTDGGGGELTGEVVTAALALVVALLPAVVEARRLSVFGASVLAAYGTGLVMSITFGSIRSDVLHPAMIYAAMPIVALVVIRIWRRRWGPGALMAILALVFMRLWWLGFMAWWGSALSSAESVFWQVVPGLNQSAVLMGSLGVLFTGAAVMAASRRAAVAWCVVAGLGLSASWLGGSRGTLIAVAVGLTVILFLTRGLGIVRSIATVILAALIVILLTTVAGIDQPFGSKRDLGFTSTARLGHSAAATGMFIDRPVVGFGPGSYRLAAVEYSTGAVHPTAHAHNEYLELFAEGGIVFGVSALLLIGGVAVAGFRLVRAGVDREAGRSDRHRSALLAGAIGAFVVLALHAAIDFDFVFAVLPILLAVVAGIVHGSRRNPVAASRRTTTTLVPIALVPIALVMVVVAAALLVVVHGPEGWQPPWNVHAQRVRVEEALTTGDTVAAGQIVDGALRWNPGDTRLLVLAAITRAPAGDARSVVDVTRGLHASFPDRNRAALGALEIGDSRAAQEIAVRAIADYPSFPGWNMTGPAGDSWLILYRAARLADGCDAAVAVATAAERDHIIGTEYDWAALSASCDE